MLMIKSLLIFFLAGLCEIGGGYMVWLTLREGKPWWIGVIGGFILALYGVVAALQPVNFGRAYAAYGGVFIAMAVIWGWKIDGLRPDKYDIVGAVIALVGVWIIMYAPRK